MKILQVMPFFRLGGAEIMCENLVYELIKLGHKVVIISLYNEETPITKRFKEKGIKIKFLDKKEGFDFSLYKKLWKVFKKEKPDVVHTHLYVTKYVFPIATLLKIKVIHTVHNVASEEATKFSRIFNNIFFKNFNVIPVALSKNIQQTIVKEYHLDKENIPIVLNGIDLSKFHKKETYDRKQFFDIVHVGSFKKAKNHIGMIDAFSVMHNKYKDCRLHLIGDGEGKKEIEQIVKEKKLSEYVIFYGLQEDVNNFLKDMDIFTLPSLYEGIPISIIEAMGTGLPIVASNVGGIPNMLDFDSALLIPVNCEALVEAWEKYYLDYELRKLHGEKVIKLSGKFSSEKMAEEYINIYFNFRR